MHIELTDGWDGATLKEDIVDSREHAMRWLKATVPDPRLISNAWCFTQIKDGKERIIIDYGSHRYFGRLTDLNK